MARGSTSRPTASAQTRPPGTRTGRVPAPLTRDTGPATQRTSLPQTRPVRASRNTAPALDIHTECLRVVGDLEDENRKLRTRIEKMEEDQKTLRAQLVEAQNSPPSRQAEVQGVVQEMLDSVNRWQQQLWAHADAMGNAAMSSTLPGTTSLADVWMNPGEVDFGGDELNIPEL